MMPQDSMTKFGSIRYIDGVFYSIDWESVFIPISHPEYTTFWDRVSEIEEQRRRPLTTNELIEMGDEISELGL